MAVDVRTKAAGETSGEARAPSLWQRASSCLGDIDDPVGRRYAAWFNGAVLLAAAAMIGWALLRRQGVDRSLVPLLALAPVVPAAAAAWAYLRLLGRLDELQRRIHLQALGVAFGGTVLLTLAYGQLEREGIVPHMNWAFVWPVTSFIWAAGLWLANRRYA